MSPETEWEQKLAFSSGVTEATHPETIQALLGPSCVRVEPHDVDRDDDGIDFRAYLRRGSVLGIDMKARESGCSRFWRPCPQTGVGLEPEFALETWSVVPDQANGVHGRTGWTLDESKATDYTLHVFDVTDTPECFLLPFQLTRMAFRRRVREWTSVYRVEQQQTRRGDRRWRSECVFVPAVVVLDAISHEMRPPGATTFKGTDRPVSEEIGRDVFGIG